MREPSADWVAISPRFTPGWPWPEDPYGLGPMYGDDGWCRGCGSRNAWLQTSRSGSTSIWARCTSRAEVRPEPGRSSPCEPPNPGTGTCGRWKWLPVSENEAPIVTGAVVATSDVIASPETFGDGLQSFRHLLFRRPLGETLVTAGPRSWDLVEVQSN